jgi:3-oxoacyl-[acyl-carrier protein] reductase
MKNVLIIGGSGGIGREISLALAGKDKNIIVHGKSRNKVKNAVTLIKEKGFTAVPFNYNIKDISLFEQRIKKFLPIHILIISFGPLLEKKLEDMSLNDWTYVYSMNAILPGTIISLCLPGMIKENYGKIILFGGTGTGKYYGYRKISAYSAAKSGLPVLAKSIAKYYGSSGIQCNIISPGFVETEYYTEQLKKKLYSSIGEGNIINCKDLAQVTRFLVSEAGNVINGAVIPVDKGFDQI